MFINFAQEQSDAFPPGQAGPAETRAPGPGDRYIYDNLGHLKDTDTSSSGASGTYIYDNYGHLKDTDMSSSVASGTETPSGSRYSQDSTQYPQDKPEPVEGNQNIYSQMDSTRL